jgi:hypothetical protein
VSVEGGCTAISGGDADALLALGRLVSVCGLGLAPAAVLAGAFLENAQALRVLDRAKLEAWRVAGEAFFCSGEGRRFAPKSRARYRRSGTATATPRQQHSRRSARLTIDGKAGAKARV